MKLPTLALLPWILSAPSAVYGSPKAAKDILSSVLSKTFEIHRNRNRKLDGSDDVIDFTNLLDPDYADKDNADDFLALVSGGLIMLKDYIHDRNDEENLGINELLGGLMDENGFVEFDIEGGYFLDLGTGSTVNLTTVGVKGLDTFREADLLRMTMAESAVANATSDGDGSHYEIPEATLQNFFVLDTLVLDLDLVETEGSRREKLKMRFPFSGVAVSSMPLLLALSEEGLKNFPLGAAINHTSHLMPCLRESVVDDASILALEATFEEIGNPSTLESSDPDFESPFFNVVSSLFVGLPASVPIFFNSTIRSVLNDLINRNVLEGPEDKSEEPEVPCHPYPSTLENDGLIDFRTFFDKGLPALLVGLLEDQLLAVDPNTGLPKINEVLIAPIVEGMGDDQELAESGTMVFGSGDEGLVDFDTSFAIGGLAADIELRVSDLTIYNLDTMIPPLSLLESHPEKPHQLNNTMTMGLDLEDERSMGLSAEVFLSIVTDENGSIEHDIRVQANMETLSLVLTALLEVVKSRLYGFPVKDILNLQCWLATLNAPAIDERTGVRLDAEAFTAGIAELKASMAKMNLDVACLEGSDGDCDSPGIEEWTDILATPEAQIGVTEEMNSVMAYAASLLSDGGAILQTPIDRILNEAAIQCPHSPSYDPEADLPKEYENIETLPEIEYSYEYLILWGSIALALILALAAVAIGVKCSVRRKQRRMLASKEVSAEELRYLARQQKEEDELEEKLNNATGSMFQSREIPLLVRWGMPVVVLGNIALFLSGHLNLGASVYIEATLAEETIKVENFFDFAIARSTIDIWKAGGKSLAILILVFSGIWPYTKQLLTLALWFLPTSVMSISTRGAYWIWIDRLAKWSMIDIFVIVVCIAAFRVSIRSPQFDFFPEDFYSINLLVVPMWGLYSNMTAQLVSQVSSHFIIYYHRCIVKKATQSLEPQSEQKEDDSTKIVLKTHSFSHPHFESSGRFVAKKWVGPSILACSILMAILAVVGSFVPSFSVELLGIIGVAVESGQDFEEAVTPHSVWSIVNLLFEEARFLDATGDYVGVGILGALVLATVMVVPILQAVGLICQWFAPLGRNGRRRLSVLNEILTAWQYIEVYLISLFVGSWQLGPVSQYMFNAYCGALDSFFAQMVSYGILKEIDAQCFGIQGSIDPGSVSLLAAAILLAIINSVVSLASKQSLADYGPPRPVNGAKEESNEESGISAEAKLRRFPVVFTDAYGWLVTAATSNDNSLAP